MVKPKKKTNKNCCNKVALAILGTLSVVLVAVMAVCLACVGAENAKLSRFSKWMAYGYAYDNCSNVMPEDGKNYFCALYEYDAEADSPYLKYYYIESDPENSEITGDTWHSLTLYFDQNGPDMPESFKDWYQWRIEYDDTTYPLDYFLIKE